MEKDQASSVQVREIAREDEIASGADYVLLMWGDENKDIRHSRGLTTLVDRKKPEHMKDLLFEAAVDDAKAWAKRHGVSVVYVIREP
jgi:hypothetical protein